MSNAIKLAMTSIAGVSIIASTAIGSLAYSEQQRNILMAKDIQSALEKGFNPMVIRCAYASQDDRVCLVYASTRPDSTHVEVLQMPKKTVK